MISAHMRRIMRATVARAEGDIHLHILVELAEDRDHPVEREPAKLGVANAREFGVRDACQLLGIAYRKLAIVEDVDDLRRDNGASLFQPCVRVPKVAVGVATSAHEFGVVVSHQAYGDKYVTALQAFY